MFWGQGGAYDCWGVASLCCESAEEAKTLIPSLTNKITDMDLQEILDDITKLRTFVDWEVTGKEDQTEGTRPWTWDENETSSWLDIWAVELGG